MKTRELYIYLVGIARATLLGRESLLMSFTYKGLRLAKSLHTAWLAISLREANGVRSKASAQNVNYWSSSEWSATHAFNLNFNSNGNLNFKRNNAKSNSFRVRPVLAYLFNKHTIIIC